MSEPITRTETYLAALAGESVTLPTPITRTEMYLAYLNGMTDTYPGPITRSDYFLYNLCQQGLGGGGATIRNQDKTITENGEYTADAGYTGLGKVTVEVDGGDDTLLYSILDRSITELSDSKATKLGTSALRGANSLKNVSFQNVTTIGNYAIAECAELEAVSFPSATKIGDYAFQKCSNLTYANIPAVTGDSALGRESFDSCGELVEINAPSLTDVGLWAFQGCAKLSKITFGKVWRIQQRGFLNCAALTEIDFPYVTQVDSDAFSGCTSLQRISLPSVTKLNTANTFKNCASLIELDLGTYLQTLTAAGASAFEGCSLLEEFDFPAYNGVVYASMFKNCTSLKKVSFGNPDNTGGGYWGGNTFGRDTIFENCTEAFQRDYQLTVDGDFGDATAQRIREVIATGEAPAVDKIAENGVIVDKDSLTTGPFWPEIVYFTRDEPGIACPCGRCGGFPVEPVERLMRNADATRKHFGRPMIPSSTVRCAAHNAELPGSAANSLHMRGKAMDFTIPGVSPDTIIEYIKTLPEVHEYYPIDNSYVHMDVQKY